jgi:hypothetical protein
MRHVHHLVAIVGLGLAVGVAGCADDPQYIDPQQNMEVGVDPTMAGMPATATVTLPIELETDKDAMDRATLAAQLGVDVPYVRIGDMAVSLEWTVKNLSDTDGVAFIDVNGGNEYFTYVPLNFVIDPEEDETPPPLMGHIPIDVPAGGQVSGVFREDEVREASIDLELITRGGMNPFAALLTNNADLTEYQPTAPIDPTMPDLGTMPVGNPIPIEAFGQIVEFDLAFTATGHMVMEYDVRVRDYRGVLHPDLLDAPAGELTMFAPAVYAPPAGTP